MGVTVTAIKVLTEYLEEFVKSTKGNVISISIRQIRKWYRERYFGEELPRKITFAVIRLLKILHRQGHLQKIGDKYVIYRDSALWKAAEKGALTETITSVTLVAESQHFFPP